jgi:tRNA dimethylallyltransferase
MLNGEIVNADSRQIYRGLDIGTAKPTAGEQARACHHLIDVAGPDESYSAGRFVREAEAALDDITGRGKTPILCGGTGFYLDSLVRPMFDEPLVATAHKDQVRGEIARMAELEGREAVHRLLAEVDPAAAERLHPNDIQRVSRALEVYRLTGRLLSELHAEQDLDSRWAPYTVVLEPERNAHQQAIRERAERMLAQGWIEEVERLLAAGVSEDAPGLQSLGYDEVIALVRGRIGREEALENIVRKTRRYAKRQRTWFRRTEAVYRGDSRAIDRSEIVSGWREHAAQRGDGREG